MYNLLLLCLPSSNVQYELQRWSHKSIILPYTLHVRTEWNLLCSPCFEESFFGIRVKIWVHPQQTMNLADLLTWYSTREIRPFCIWWWWLCLSCRGERLKTQIKFSYNRTLVLTTQLLGNSVGCGFCSGKTVENTSRYMLPGSVFDDGNETWKQRNTTAMFVSVETVSEHGGDYFRGIIIPKFLGRQCQGVNIQRYTVITFVGGGISI